ncbi:MAG: DUF3021 domain-containing protein [Lachnospiraceae bacterium]|nr:DUF3021 domain-containing protein [Lachnospiraceae bacterium]
MKKQAILRGMIGIPVGISLGYIITILISLVHGEGYYAACVPALIEMAGSEINAVILQTILCGILGMTFAASSIIWELDHWSIAKQTGVYFLITAFVMLPIAYLTHWMEHSLKGFLSYSAIFLGIFIIMWISMYLVYRKNVKQLNAKIGN